MGPARACTRRIRKTLGGGSPGELLYDGLNLVQEHVGGTPTANLLTGGLDEVFSRTDAAGTRTPLGDAVASTLALTDAGGAVQRQYTHEPFGRTTATGAASANPFQYMGRENDGTGLYHYRAVLQPDAPAVHQRGPAGVWWRDQSLHVRR